MLQNLGIDFILIPSTLVKSSLIHTQIFLCYLRLQFADQESAGAESQ